MRVALLILLLVLLIAPVSSALPPDRRADDPAWTRGDIEPFEALALSWYGAADATIRVRVSSDGQQWSDWREAVLDHDMTDEGEARAFSSIMHFDRIARFVETSSEESVRELTITIFPLPALPARRREQTDTFRVGDVDVRSRTDWGCPDGQGSRWTPAYSNVTHLIVHHTAGSNTLVDWDAEMRNIWQFHTITRGWGDIGYNFLIAPDGVVYEGRAGGNGTIAAHFSCRNTNTMGVALLGTFTSVAPTEAALASLKAILKELAAINRVRADQAALHVPSGLTLFGVSGHRDGNAAYPLVTCSTTECPGNVLYGILPSIRTDVAACVVPSMTLQPAGAHIVPGASARLLAAASGSDLTYQWYEGAAGILDVPIAGATTPAVVVAPMATTSYWMRASNGCGHVDSDSVTVTVIAAPARRRSL